VSFSFPLKLALNLLGLRKDISSGLPEEEEERLRGNDQRGKGVRIESRGIECVRVSE